MLMLIIRANTREHVKVFPFLLSLFQLVHGRFLLADQEIRMEKVNEIEN